MSAPSMTSWSPASPSHNTPGSDTAPRGGCRGFVRSIAPPDILTLSTLVRVFKNIFDNDVKPRSCRLSLSSWLQDSIWASSRRILVTECYRNVGLTQIILPYLVYQTATLGLFFFIALLARELRFEELVVNSDPKGHCRLEKCAVER